MLSAARYTTMCRLHGELRWRAGGPRFHRQAPQARPRRAAPTRHYRALTSAGGSPWIGRVAVRDDGVVWRRAVQPKRRIGEGGLQALPHDGDGGWRDLNPDPAAIELLRRLQRCAAAAKRVEHQIAGIRASQDDPLQERERLLGQVAQLFA